MTNKYMNTAKLILGKYDNSLKNYIGDLILAKEELDGRIYQAYSEQVSDYKVLKDKLSHITVLVTDLDLVLEQTMKWRLLYCIKRLISEGYKYNIQIIIYSPSKNVPDDITELINPQNITVQSNEQSIKSEIIENSIEEKQKEEPKINSGDVINLDNGVQLWNPLLVLNKNEENNEEYDSIKSELLKGVDWQQ